MKKYWKSLTELKNGENSVPDQPMPKGNLEQILDIFDKNESGSKSNRRDFLKLCGFSLAISTVVASCENSVQKAIPYLIKPEEITPGKANYYASSFAKGSDYCSILIKTREGRPIKIEGNDLSGVTNGGTSSRVQASVLDLYDTGRYKHPKKGNQKLSWEELDETVKKELNRLKNANEQVVLLTSSVYSPSTINVIQKFIAQYPNVKWVQYDSQSASALIQANEMCFGKAGIADYRFDYADMIVSFDADFLGTWLMPVEHIRQYTKKRKLCNGNTSMSHHTQIESRLSLTGSNADKRIPVKPSEQKLLIVQLYNEILKLAGKEVYSTSIASADIQNIAKELCTNKGKSLVVSGSKDTNVQVIVNAINFELENYGSTLRVDKQLHTYQAKDSDMNQLLEDMKSGKLKGIISYGVNPVFDYQHGNEFASALKKIGFSVAMDEVPNETTALMSFVAPDNHFLESWNDFEPKTNRYSLMQPGIRPLFDTRQFQSSLLSWMGEDSNYLNFIKNHWEKNMYPIQMAYPNFTTFWNHTLQQGVFEPSVKSVFDTKFSLSDMSRFVSQLAKQADNKGVELQLYESIAIGDGKMANNPWLQEMPDPVTKICWDNYLCVSPKQAEEMMLETGDVVELNSQVKLPVYVLPGQAYNTVAVATGYGRQVCGIVGKNVGVNVNYLLQSNDDFIGDINLTKTGEKYDLAMTQTHHSMEGRAIVREAGLEEYKKNPSAGNESHHAYENASIYEKPKFPNHHWGLVVDLNSCVGCGACSIACQSENNVPVVGKKEVIRAHEMSWIRIDRYFSGDEFNPDVSFQPVMCQHCDNAPCENVCPVAATNHSSEGLNQMAYNRCIGTRYCGNNCPYKVRRFNWFDYTKADSIPNNLHDVAEMTIDLKRMVLNPDVTIRAKGVIEKCSLCVQRIQEGKLNAKIEGRKVKDGEIKTACQQACPSGAIIFGDLNDKESKLVKETSSKRNYHLLEEIHTLPSVSYLTKIRNKKMNHS
ncbi:Fe-S-cluster-containing hydrogenase [Marinifilum flexuosum]|uniref:Quinol:cytochrome c oxidoreductase iron-sulfur protein n=1 Tax=Marinifilum flexuosum TaxID=1117708 RepID=A0A419X7D4_9BACT|nr:Fe-S-cluster-containing hydrogenase [Marinifilum flexuosum]RKE03647.1 quinol:cytochrome c oxidoreductase iron-sulfur protein precursor [Marinifilum flexuosum]